MNQGTIVQCIGAVTELLLVQPNGTFSAKRKP